MLSCEFEGKKILVWEQPADWLRQAGLNNELKCPECKSKVLYRKGTYRPHFYHYRKVDCKIQPESEEHEIGKKYIFDILNQKYEKQHILLEEKIESAQRSDVLLIRNNRRFAFEVQFSPQSDAEWKERTQKYRDFGIEPIWILGYKRPIEAILNHDNFGYSDVCDHVSINLGMNKQNAGIQIESFGHSTAYILHKHRSDIQIFHLLTVVEGISSLYIGFVRQVSKTTVYGSIAKLGENWEFSEEFSRFLPSTEVHFNEKIKNERIHRQKQNDNRKELETLILKYYQCQRLLDIPEIKFQETNNVPKIEKFFSTGYKMDSVQDRLLAEIAIYVKFVKNQPKGYKFTFSNHVRQFLEKWGFVTADNKDFLFAQTGMLLSNLRKAGILDKPKHSDVWTVTGKKII